MDNKKKKEKTRQPEKEGDKGRVFTYSEVGPDLDTEGEERAFESTFVVDYFDKIEDMFSKRPLKKNKKVWREWQLEINRLIEVCNNLAKRECYDKV